MHKTNDELHEKSSARLKRALPEMSYSAGRFAPPVDECRLAETTAGLGLFSEGCVVGASNLLAYVGVPCRSNGYFGLRTPYAA